MEIALYVLGVLALAAGLAGLVLPVLPGAPLLLVGVVLVAWGGHFTAIGWGTIAAAAVITGLMLAVDWVAGVLGAKAFGASRWAMWGALAGALVGLFFGIPGIVFGPAIGAVAFELWKDPDLPRAAKAGTGVLVGFLLGTAVKVTLGMVLVGLVVLALLW
ncbi:MAG: DUF456 family protein [Deltaproteobacteria bacterium]|nr:DUF456 family protein [Deltaproteobacteria bacterium]